MNKVLKNIGIVTIFGLVAFFATDVLAQPTGVGAINDKVIQVLEMIQKLCYIIAAIGIFWIGFNALISGKIPDLNWDIFKPYVYGLILVYGATWAAQLLVSITKGLF